jgi:hypothetical protein
MKYFIKPVKISFRTLTGDYHISTSLSFNEFKLHPNKVASWLDLNGYNITYNECQDSDMVLVGLLSRVDSMTWRDDLKNEIMSLTEWQDNPFFFRLYPSTLSCNIKCTMTFVLMIDVDHPNIDRGLAFFRKIFNGDFKTSTCSIPYIFFMLYGSKLTDNDRQKIIEDTNHHVNHISYIHIQGIKDIDVIV